MISAIIHGFILAFGLILPLGVQNVFVFNQGATQPRFSRALPVIITASLCDTFLISLAVLGVSVIVFGIPWIKFTLLLVGILFLAYMGFVTWKSKSNTSLSEANALSPKKQITFATSVSLLNPHAIMDTIGVIGTSSLSYSGMDKLGFALACITTSWIWFIALALVGRQVGRLNNSGGFITVLNKISALIMWGTAIYLIFTLI
ncbi:lysine efflux permease [Schinkia azotoformans MEV2011]|uniref:Lysine efflux permease n=1 Tax=Schinkia azotoformans MEV2011 TaxID=1348973 RepID=A0A072NX35_SCHAZ|nr:LysE/ArgO family amino acid transporter [Schinkia azotoformans]KEF37790.1 lysine efflux permease [Schinkia azotoformans MEV2011]MEC1697671.1 LysE/ArgO family amino acid transporter [Schinkia azotoformans]MEC1724019.1 LysE/ArgO family amino acid transporter [Schinkia azotoformans]MEC1770953.1 LysE/ArgO family amino acid transporter [Schinkia azotoformans]MEC1778346.1 LysE/ArgO family amino acid transporter [Schinkia azotoformans]